MNNYIIITTLCNNEQIADKIQDTLLAKKLVAGSQISKVQSKYWWNNKLECNEEFKLEFRTKEILFGKIKTEIIKIHDYETAEISCTKIINANSEFLKWIDENTLKEDGELK